MEKAKIEMDEALVDEIDKCLVHFNLSFLHLGLVRVVLLFVFLHHELASFGAQFRLQLEFIPKPVGCLVKHISIDLGLDGLAGSLNIRQHGRRSKSQGVLVAASWTKLDVVMNAIVVRHCDINVAVVALS